MLFCCGKKADKENVEEKLSRSQFETVCDEINQMINDILTKLLGTVCVIFCFLFSDFINSMQFLFYFAFLLHPFCLFKTSLCFSLQQNSLNSLKYFDITII